MSYVWMINSFVPHCTVTWEANSVSKHHFLHFLKIIYWYTHNKFNENYASLGATIFTLYKLVSINSFSYIKHFKYSRGNIDLRCSISFKPLTKVFLLSTCIWCCNTEGQLIAKPWTGTAHYGCFDSPINHDTED